MVYRLSGFTIVLQILVFFLTVTSLTAIGNNCAQSMFIAVNSWVKHETIEQTQFL